MHGEARTLNGSRRSKRSRGPGRGADATTAAVAAGGGGVLAAVGLRQLGEPAGGAQPSAAGRTWAAAGAGLFAGALVGLAAAWAGLRLLLAAGAAWMPEEVMRALTDLRVAALGWGTLAFTV